MSILSVNDWFIDNQKSIKELLMKKFLFSSISEVTKIEKIVISSAVSQATKNKKLLDDTISAIKTITLQKPLVKKTKKSIAAFNLRKGMQISCLVTLRKKMAWNFLFKLIFLYIPRTRDLRGFSSKNFDNNGNLNIGISDFTIFHEVDYGLIFNNQGLQVNIVFSSNKVDENKYFLELLNFPFKK